MNYWLVIYTKKDKRYFTKYFETIKDLIKFKNKLRFIEDFILIEDSRDIDFGGYNVSD